MSMFTRSNEIPGGEPRYYGADAKYGYAHPNFAGLNSGNPMIDMVVSMLAGNMFAPRGAGLGMPYNDVLEHHHRMRQFSIMQQNAFFESQFVKNTFGSEAFSNPWVRMALNMSGVTQMANQFLAPYMGGQPELVNSAIFAKMTGATNLGFGTTSNVTGDLASKIGQEISKSLQSTSGIVDPFISRGFSGLDVANVFAGASRYGLLRQMGVKDGLRGMDTMVATAGQASPQITKVLQALQGIVGQVDGEQGIEVLNQLLGRSNFNLNDVEMDGSNRVESFLRNFRAAAKTAGISVDALLEINQTAREVMRQSSSTRLVGGVTSMNIASSAAGMVSTLGTSGGMSIIRSFGGTANMTNAVAAGLAAAMDSQPMLLLQALASIDNEEINEMLRQPNAIGNLPSILRKAEQLGYSGHRLRIMAQNPLVISRGADNLAKQKISVGDVAMELDSNILSSYFSEKELADYRKIAQESGIDAAIKAVNESGRFQIDDERSANAFAYAILGKEEFEIRKAQEAAKAKEYDEKYAPKATSIGVDIISRAASGNFDGKELWDIAMSVVGIEPGDNPDIKAARANSMLDSAAAVMAGNDAKGYSIYRVMAGNGKMKSLDLLTGVDASGKNAREQMLAWLQEMGFSRAQAEKIATRAQSNKVGRLHAGNVFKIASEVLGADEIKKITGEGGILTEDEVRAELIERTRIENNIDLAGEKIGNNKDALRALFEYRQIGDTSQKARDALLDKLKEMGVDSNAVASALEEEQNIAGKIYETQKTQQQQQGSLQMIQELAAGLGSLVKAITQIAEEISK